MTESMFADPEMGARLIKDYPLGVGEIEDIVNGVEFIISQKARWITGQQLIIDGGRTINISA